MGKGFFSEAQQSEISFSIPRCSFCGLHRTGFTPKMPVAGEGKRGVLFVGESPSDTDDRACMPFMGQAGQMLRDIVDDIGWDFDADCWSTNAVICSSSEGKEVAIKQIDACRPSLMKTVKELQPKVVVLLGTAAVRSLLAPIWKKDMGAISRWVGWKIPIGKQCLWACPIWNPTYLIRQNSEVTTLWFKRYLEAALRLNTRPCAPPNYEGQVRREKNHRRAASFIQKFIAAGRPIAFDYETDRLKPDEQSSEIVSCAISDGKHTVAYPWAGEAIAATGELLKSSIPKIAANLKFEECWTKKVFGHEVRNWQWDTMQAAHVLNNERGITSVKFQAFVRLGVGDYDSHISSYLKSSSSNVPNRIKELDLSSLLLYNGMDALLEYRIAQDQMREMGI